MDFFFCSIFVAEAVLRATSFRERHYMVEDWSFIFDSCLTCVMVVDTWIMPLIAYAFLEGDFVAKLPTGVNMIRLLKVLRLGRLARLAQATPEAMVLLKGLYGAMRSVAMMLCLLLLVLYIFSIVFMQMTAGNGSRDKYFPDIFVSMYNLLLRGAFMDEITEFADGLLADHGGVMYVIVFLMFVFLTTYLLMNMLIGLMCEVVSAIAQTENHHIMEEYVQEELYAAMKDYDMATTIGVTREQYCELMQHPELSELWEAIGVSNRDLIGLSDIIFDHEDGIAQNGFLAFHDMMMFTLQLRGDNTATVKDLVQQRQLVMRQLRITQCAISQLKTDMVTLGMGMELVDNKVSAVMADDGCGSKVSSKLVVSSPVIANDDVAACLGDIRKSSSLQQNKWLEKDTPPKEPPVSNGAGLQDLTASLVKLDRLIKENISAECDMIASSLQNSSARASLPAGPPRTPRAGEFGKLLSNRTFRIGDRVRLGKLAGAGSDEVGVLVDLDASSARWKVRLADGAVMDVSPENLQIDYTAAATPEPLQADCRGNQLAIEISGSGPPCSSSGGLASPRVRLCSSNQRPELNGLTGRLVSWNDAAQRWMVEMEDGSTKMVRHRNVELLAPSSGAEKKPAEAAEKTAQGGRQGDAARPAYTYMLEVGQAHIAGSCEAPAAVCRIQGKEASLRTARGERLGAGSPAGSTWLYNASLGMTDYEPGDALEVCIFDEDARGGDGERLHARVLITASEIKMGTETDYLLNGPDEASKNKIAGRVKLKVRKATPEDQPPCMEDKGSTSERRLSESSSQGRSRRALSSPPPASEAAAVAAAEGAAEAKRDAVFDRLASSGTSSSSRQGRRADDVVKRESNRFKPAGRGMSVDSRMSESSSKVPRPGASMISPLLAQKAAASKAAGKKPKELLPPTGVVGANGDGFQVGSRVKLVGMLGRLRTYEGWEGTLVEIKGGQTPSCAVRLDYGDVAHAPKQADKSSLEGPRGSSLLEVERRHLCVPSPSGSRRSSLRSDRSLSKSPAPSAKEITMKAASPSPLSTAFPPLDSLSLPTTMDSQALPTILSPRSRSSPGASPKSAASSTGLSFGGGPAGMIGVAGVGAQSSTIMGFEIIDPMARLRACCNKAAAGKSATDLKESFERMAARDPKGLVPEVMVKGALRKVLMIPPKELSDKEVGRIVSALEHPPQSGSRKVKPGDLLDFVTSPAAAESPRTPEDHVA
eukprot:TRINITY_DN5983_c0_g1_i10.p1 TRINITY_DN5983_c0_g1~~TRINITY_DN5983_c0_g1_i10.p1  ORF type:complete len:1411 (+),score=301.65 TRINITY_DN5983_c0_g1_i10:585-4235(+)